MAEMNKINVDELENVAGGATRTVANDAVNYANVREKPGLNTKVMLATERRPPRSALSSSLTSLPTAPTPYLQT